ncbi:hypothetical protein Emtol_2834 [Emticicia oligotrophica DSM 17448]|uniref:Outer membrane protein beta-barrel domain-containing protein n=2 Tax=Leadbetterellaceae TaxID=3141702 RepID=A0ABN4ANF3_EMTOG|nr:hypothetical protein Emtol_2834 [Emticicia oligotrophica DSM 17448]
MYNFPLKTVGVGLRSQIPVNDKLLLVPSVKYAPQFNEIHEIYAGVNAHLVLISSVNKVSYRRSQVQPQKPNLYLSVGADYNQWFNYISSANSKADKQNILPMVGLGTSFGSHTMRFFAEVKYNALWNESNGEIGLLIYPGFIKDKKRNNCPVIR